MRTHFTFAVVCLLLVSLATTSRAAEGRVPIFEPLVLDGTAGPISGRYILTRDIEATAGAVAIDIVGSGNESVDIDLNGFTITGGTTAPAVVRVRGAGIGAFTMRNGTLVGGNHEYDAAVVTVTGSESDASDNMLIEDVKIIAGGMAIEGTYVTNFALRRNIIAGSAVGIILTNNFSAAAPRMTGVIEGNILRNLEFDAIDVLDGNRSVTIRNNQIVGQSGTGITVDETLSLVVAGNNIEGGSVGIQVIGGNDCLISDNAITSSTGDGILLISSDDCFIRENLTNNNGGAGIFLFEDCDGNFIDRNVVNNNGWMGIYFDTDSRENVYGRNVLRANMGQVTCDVQNAPAPCASPAVCDMGTGNTSFGDNMGPGPGC